MKVLTEVRVRNNSGYDSRKWPIWLRYEVSRKYKVSRVRSGKYEVSDIIQSNLVQYNMSSKIELTFMTVTYDAHMLTNLTLIGSMVG